MRNTLFDDAKVRITPDGMAAYLRLPPIPAEEKYNFDDVMTYLRSQKVTTGIDDEEVLRMIDTPIYGREVCIARGKRPVNGQNGEMIYKFSRDLNRKPKLLEDGSVDYWSIHTIELVTAGQVIVEYREPTDAIDGVTVGGKKVPAKKGHPHAPLKGKGFSCSEDGHIYTSDVCGKIEMTKGRIRISEVYEVDGDVGLKTGNIDFNGDVVVHGGVLPGASVKAKGNIIVDGICESCNLESEKDIVLRSGVLGGNKTHIQAKGNIHAKFFEYCEVEAEGFIEATSALDCKMISYDHIYLAGKKAGIVGGYSYAAAGMEMDVLGSQSEVRTEAVVGVSREIARELEDAQNLLDEQNEMVEKIAEGLRQYDDAAKENGGDANQNELRTILFRTRMTKQAEIAKLKKKIERLEAISVRAKGASIRVLHEVYPRTKVSVDQATLTVKEEQTSVEFIRRKENVVMLSIAFELV